MVGLNLSKPKKQNSQSEQNHWNRHESSETKIATGFALLFPGVLLLLLLLLLLLCLFVCLFFSAASCAMFLTKNIASSCVVSPCRASVQ